MPATCVAWNEFARVERRAFAYLEGGAAGANVRCTITFGVVSFVRPFGNPGGYWKPLGLKYGVGRVEAVVDDPDLHPVAGGREVRAPQLVGADLRPGRRCRRSEW